MAAGLNRVSIIGNLGKDPEVRFTPSGTAVCTLRVGATERRKEGEEYKDHTEWVSVVVFGKTAENAGKFLQKGRQVFIEGRLQTRKWEDKKTNETRYTTEVIAREIIFLGSKDSNSSTSNYSRNEPSQSGQEHDMSANGFIEDDEIPF